MRNKNKSLRKPALWPSIRRKSALQEGCKAKGPVSVRSISGLSHPVRGKLGLSLAER
jgi:hypothetical protein